MKRLFEVKLYVKVSRNRFKITRISGEPAVEIVSSSEPFSTTRLLIGQFSLAEDLLSQGINKLLPKRNLIIERTPAILIQPIEMNEGGLSEVEVKILREIALGVGAHVVWNGQELSPHQVVEKLDNV